MQKNKYQPYETEIIDENLDEISSHNNLNTESIEQNDKSNNFNYGSPKKNEQNIQNNPLLNADTTLKSLRISHSNEKSEESQILINRINGIKSPKKKPIKENNFDLYCDMFEIINKENDLNKNNLKNENNNKIQPITNKKIHANNNIKYKKLKTNNSIRFSNYNNFKNAKISISNKLKTKFKNFNPQQLKKKKTSYSKKISIQQLFKQKFEERSKNNSQITHKIQQHKYDNFSSPNYLEDSLCKEKAQKEFSTIENSESFYNINLTYVPQYQINLNSTEYMQSLFDDHDNEDNHENDYDDKNIMVSELDIKLTPSSAKKNTKKPLIKVKKYFSNDGSNIRKYLFKTKNLNKKTKSISQKNNNIKKNKNSKIVKNNNNHIEFAASSMVGFNNYKNNLSLNKNKVIYKKINRMKTGFSNKNDNKTKRNFKNINFGLRNSSKIKTISREKTEYVSSKPNKIKLIKKYFLTHKINSNLSFQTNKRLTNYPTINKKKITQSIINLDNIKSNNKITKKSDIPICVIKNKNKIPIIKNKNHQSKISYLNIVKRMNSINNKINTSSFKNFYQFNSINNSRNVYENKLNNNSYNRLDRSSFVSNERLITDFNKSVINSRNANNNNLFHRINTIKAMKSMNGDSNKILVHKKVFKDLSYKLGKGFLFE